MNHRIYRPALSALRSLALAAALSYGGGYWLHLLHTAGPGAARHGDLGQWLRDSTLMLPITLLALALALATTRRLIARDPGAARYGAALGAGLIALFASLGAALGGPLYAALAGSDLARQTLAGPGGAALFICAVVGSDGGQSVAAPAGILRDASLLLLANLLIAAAFACPPALRAAGAGLRHRLASVSRRAALAAATLLAVVAGSFDGLLVLQPAAVAAAAASVCDAGSADRRYDVAAVNVHVPYNRWGDIDPDGMVYVLQGDKSAVRGWHMPLGASPQEDPAGAGNRRLRPRPLVLRANAGDCLEITFSNELNRSQWGGALLDPRASMHIVGLAYSAQTSDGGRVGYNQDSTVGIGETITYYWQAPQQEGLFTFRDTAAVTGTEADGGSVAHGLFGGLVVEPAGSQWLDGSTGAPLYSGTGGQSGELYIDAIIDPPGAEPAFRESVQLAQDEIPMVNGGVSVPGFGFNYGSEPEHNRDAQRCPDCVGEETSLSSWTYGDPALVKLASGYGPWLPSWQTGAQGSPEDCGLGTPGFAASSCWTANVTHGYRWDRFKLRYALAMTYETHIFHLHANQWRAQDKDPQSTIIDSQTFGPGDAFTADLIGGAGSLPGTVGDSIFHCHLYPHFADGFWALLRVHDVVEDGSGVNPDGLRVSPVRPLPSGNLRGFAPPAPSQANPGYPRFIPGEYGWRAPQPPLGISEQAAPGAADNQATVAREDLAPALRMVAGQALDPALLGTPDAQLTQAQLALKRRLEAERRAMSALSGGQSKPGAPFADPCPAGAREVTYNLSIIQLPIVYNEAGWYDSQARILVHNRDVADVLAGRKAPEPMFMRVNQGDCVNLNLTNRLPNWFGNDAFVRLAQTNMMGGHIHLVKFDVLASDGSSNGWNYQQAAFTQLQTAFKNNVLAGAQSCTRDEAAGACRIPMPDPAGYSPKASGDWPGQTIHERWYADTELRTIFTHDHHFAAIDQNRGQFGALIVEPVGMDMRHPTTGAFFQPINDPAHGTPCMSFDPAAPGQCNGAAVGTRMDLIGPGAKDDFREFSLAFQDFVSLTRRGGDPANRADTINPPAAPELFPKADPGTMGINYRNAPFQERRFKGGQYIDPAYLFSSTVWGDPMTPLLEAYAGDPVQFRVIQGSQEEQHVVQVHGMRWRHEPADPESTLVGAEPIGISEAFNMQVPQMSCGWDEDCRGDYLYSSGATDDLYNGMWGLFRVYGRNRNGLLPLPDTQPQDMNGNVSFKPTGSPPPMANKPGTPCVPGAPTRSFGVVAHQANIVYNEYGYHDPYGLLYTAVRPGETLDAAVARGQASPEPLVLRANEGDCIEVTLHNRIDPSWQSEHGLLGVRDGDAPMPTEPFGGTPAGLRVSLHPQLLLYDVRGSDGATVGYNRDQTVGPGQSILYRWYADDVSPGELGAINLLEYGDVRGHRHHGMSASIVIGPRGASYHSPLTGAEVADGAFVDVRVPGQPDYRDMAVFYQDGLNLRHADGGFVAEPAAALPAEQEEVPEGGPADPTHPLGEGSDEDAGEKAFNYGSEPLNERLGRLAAAATANNPLNGRELADLFSSLVHGDPATPILRAYAGDPVRLRLMQTGDRPRQHVFQIGGHGWLEDPYDPTSRYVGALGGVSVAVARNIHVAAGGDVLSVGDFRYGSMERNFFESRGLWGLFRVYGRPQAAAVFTPDALAAQDNPHLSGYHPLMPLERASVGATVFADANGNLAQGGDEGGVAGVTVRLKNTSGAVLATALTDPRGAVRFHVAPGAYDLEVVPPAGWVGSTPLSLRSDATGENASTRSAFGLIELGSLSVRVFNDRDGDGQRAGDEGDLAGWSVRLSQGGLAVGTATTGADGAASFGGLRPGSYQASVAPPAGWFATTPAQAKVSVGAGEAAAAGFGFAVRAGLSVQLFNDSNGNGVRDGAESWLGGWRVSAAGGPLEGSTASGRTNSQGYVTLDNPDPAIDGMLPGSYSIGVGAGSDWGCASYTVSVGGAAGPARGCAGGVESELIADTTQVVTVAMRNPNHWVVAEPFVDANRNGVRDGGEGKLVGWRADLYEGAALVASGLTGNDGRASWYRAGQGGATRSYRVQITPPTGTALPWASTLPGGATSLSLTVIAGETGVALMPFVQLSTVSVAVFHDQDSDGAWDGHEAPLANRNVIFYDKDAKTILAQGVTDANGQVPFRLTAGRTYYVEAVLPTGWARTSPVDAKGAGVVKLKIVAPKSGDGLSVTFGQYNTGDTTPPPAPAFSAAPGSHLAPLVLSFDSEDNVRYRYTLDGSAPSATAGYPLVDPAITLATAGPVTVRVVAIDAKSNVSPVSQASYTIAPPAEPLETAGFSTGVTSWKVTRGGVAVGYVEGTHHADGQPMSLRSVKIGKVGYIDGYGSVVLPAGQRDLASLRVIDIARGDRTGIAKRYYLYNWAIGDWELVWGPSTLDTFTATQELVVDGDLARFVSPGGELRVRYEAWTAYGTVTNFLWSVDQLLVKTAYRP